MTTFAVVASALNVSATGFRLPDQDAFATARGEAFAATADNPSAIYYNTAGITQLEGDNLRGGIYGIYLDPSFRPPSPNDTTYANQAKLHAAPQLYYTHTLENQPVSFGIGMFAPYGLGLRWPQDTGFRTLGTSSSLTSIPLNPVVAFQVLPNFSVGGGVTVNYSEADLQQGL